MAYSITTAEAAEILEVDTSRVRQLVLEGKLTAQKIGSGNRATLLLNPIEVCRFARKARPVGRPPAPKPGRKKKTGN